MACGRRGIATCPVAFGRQEHRVGAGGGESGGRTPWRASGAGAAPVAGHWPATRARSRGYPVQYRISRGAEGSRTALAGDGRPAVAPGRWTARPVWLRVCKDDRVTRCVRVQLWSRSRDRYGNYRGTADAFLVGGSNSSSPRLLNFVGSGLRGARLDRVAPPSGATVSRRARFPRARRRASGRHTLPYPLDTHCGCVPAGLVAVCAGELFIRYAHRGFLCLPLPDDGSAMPHGWRVVDCYW